MHFGCRPYEAMLMPYAKLSQKNDGTIVFRLSGDITKTHQEYNWYLTSKTMKKMGNKVMVSISLIVIIYR